MTDDIPKDRVKELRQEAILCRVKYHNNLPELPFDPKFLPYPFEPTRFVQYAATSLERNHKHELLCETDVGVDVDLIDPSAFKTDRTASLHPDDEKLLEDDDPNAINDRRSRHQRSVAWLRKTEYLSTEHYNKWNKSEKIETKLGHNVKQRFAEEIVYRDRESQINAIEATFTAAKKPIQRHYSKPGVHAVEVLPLLPDFKLWRYPCAQVIFDDDPARKGISAAEQREEVNQAVIRGMVDETGDHFVVYFLPTEETKQQRRFDAENHVAFTEGASYEYEKAREYNWNVKNKTMTNYEENYFFVFRKDDKDCPAGVYYNELETRVRLSKRRKVQSSFGGGPMAPPQPPSKMRLVVQHRDFTYEELQAQTARLDMLKHESEDEEEEEEAEQEHPEAQESEGEAQKNHSPLLESPSPASGAKRGPQLHSDSEGEHSSLEGDEEAEQKATLQSHLGTRRSSTKRSTTAAVFSDDDDEEEEEGADKEEEEEGKEIHDTRHSVSSDLSNDSPPRTQSPIPSRFSSKRPTRKRSFTEVEDNSGSDNEDERSPSPPPSHRRRQEFTPAPRPSVNSSSRRPVLSESDDDLSSLSG
ncbi:RNA polymerase II-associated factor 1 -like protein [Echinococcus granulosus]|uniref:RNA polymerase II-associated factor 1 homolog n=1 Tax=Echinococcus granulosus TaxID=6210 RepID=U6JAQ3_ECHGR|nr:RNA polymerase II-associated factor [Echinococcus granulosus]EUB64024.1 RNA polymerase II-associated factor [Echinococcus granulosus]KAH9280049.1 RNA polymerase II-associated factor 1 -like protein [Echinococcus granulosus]CDS19531.1 RNA polymerase II associated factor 1 [Echinococcus granulosus]